MDAKPFPDDVCEYLKLHHVVTLGTSSFTGMPHADTVVFTNDQWRLFFAANENSDLLRKVFSYLYCRTTVIRPTSRGIPRRMHRGKKLSC